MGLKSGVEGTIDEFIFTQFGSCTREDKTYSYDFKKQADILRINIFIPRGSVRETINETQSYGGETWNTGSTKDIMRETGGRLVQSYEINVPLEKYPPSSIIAEGRTAKSNYCIRLDNGQTLYFDKNEDEWRPLKPELFRETDPTPDSILKYPNKWDVQGWMKDYERMKQILNLQMERSQE